MFQIRYMCAELWQYLKLTALHLNTFTVCCKKCVTFEYNSAISAAKFDNFFSVEIEINSTVYLLDDIITVSHYMLQNCNSGNVACSLRRP